MVLTYKDGSIPLPIYLSYQFVYKELFTVFCGGYARKCFLV